MISDKTLFNHLNCKRITWMNEYCAKDKKANLPSWITQISREKRVLISHYLKEHGAVRIKNYRDEKKSIQDTLTAINNGEDLIVNGILRWNEFVVKIDILQRLPKNHFYWIGEINMSEELKSTQLIRLEYLNYVLSQVQGVQVPAAFILSNDFIIKPIHLSNYKNGGNPYMDKMVETIEDIKKVVNLSSDKFNEFNSYSYSQNCIECEWRYHCIPKIIKARPLTLLPNIGESREKFLKENGVNGLDQIREINDDEFRILNFDDIEIKQIKRAANKIENGKLIFNKQFRNTLFHNAIPISLSLRKRSGIYLFSKGFYLKEGKIEEIPVEPTDNPEQFNFMLPSYFNDKELWLSGYDYDVFVRTMLCSDIRHLRIHNLTKFFKENIKTPLPGLELLEILEFVENGYDFQNLERMKSINLNAIERLKALSKILEWIKTQIV